MNVKSVEKENGKAKVVVEIDKPEFEQALNKAYAKCRKDIMLPGFRKGKAPRKMVESMYGATVFYEDAVNEIFPEIYTTAIVDQQLKAVGSPSVSNMDTPDEGGVVLTIETELYPEVTLGQYKGIEVPKREVKVEESEVDAEVNRMAERNARIETVDRAAQMATPSSSTSKALRAASPSRAARQKTTASRSAPARSFPALKRRWSALSPVKSAT